jgi:diguanylate cyclase (GGDEF)-like protein/PAS domain S-box-containing protein
MKGGVLSLAEIGNPVPGEHVEKRKGTKMSKKPEEEKSPIQKVAKPRKQSSKFQRFKAELKQSEDTIELIPLCVDQAPVGIGWVGQNGHYRYANSYVCRLLGYSREELLSMTIHDITPDLPKEVWPKLWEKLRKLGSFTLETTNLTKDGRTMPVKITAHYLKCADREYGCLFIQDIIGHGQTEEVSARLMAILESSDDAIIGKDLNGTIVTWNKGAEKIYGYTAEEVINKPISILVPPDYVAEPAGFLDQIRRGERIEHRETVRLRKDGSRINISLTMSPIKNAAGKIVGASTIGRDITERKEAEEALWENEARYRSLFEDAVEGIAVAEAKTRKFLRANQAFCRMLGYSHEEISAMGVEDIHPAESLEYVFGEFNAHTSGKNVLAADVPCLRRDGTIFYADIAGSAILLDGKICNVAFFNDVTERKKLNDALRENEKRFKQVAESAGEWIWELDTDGLYTYSSPAVEKILGYKPDEIVGRMRFYDFFVPEEREDVKKAAFETFSKKEAFRSFENQNLHKNGARVILETSGTPSLDEQGRLIGYRGADTDITDRRKAEEASRKREEEFRAIADYTYDWESWIAPDGALVWVNPAVEKFTGYSREEWLSQPPLRARAVLEEDQASVLSHHKKGLEERISGNDIPFRVRHKDGSIRWAAISYQPIYAANGDFLGLRTSVRDITERKQAEETLRENEMRLRTVIETVREGIIFSDKKGHFEAYNSAMERLTGYSADEANSSSDYTTILYPDPKDRDKALAGLNELTTIGMSREAETEIRTKEGMQKYALVSTTLIPYKDQIMFLSSYHDITQRKRTEAQIAKLGFLKERLIGELSFSEKLTLITDGVVEIFGADFARIWLIREGDLCEKGCIHAEFKEGTNVCRDRARCLHLVASSGRYTHTDGNHRRVPVGRYKIGCIASGEDSRFIAADVAHDPWVHDREWARALGLVSFAGFRLLSPDGAPIGVLALFSKRATPPVVAGLMAGLSTYLSQVILSDRAREALLASETKFRTLFENANDSIFLLKEDIFVDCNPKTLQMFQCSRDQIVGQTPYRISPPLQPDGRDSKEKALEKFHAALAGNPQFFEWKHCLYDGTPFDAEVSLNSIELGNELFIQAIVRDVTDRKLLEEALRTRSIVDELTGLYNRRGFLTLCEQQLKIAERAEKSVVLLFIDLDHMKWINDTFGHQEGDRALVETAAILRKTFRESDIIGRLGGDEFGVLAIDTAHEERKTVARLLDALDSYNRSETRGFKLSLSAGAAHFDPENPSSLDDLIATADNLMYQEKRRLIPQE